MIPATSLKPLDPIYTFVTPQGVNYNIASGLLREWTLKAKPEVYNVPINKELAKSFFSDNVVSRARIVQLLSEVKGGTRVLDPVIFAITDIASDGSANMMLVDGHHRYAVFAVVGLKYIPGHVLERKAWEPFQVEGIPDISKENLKAIPILKRNY